MVVFVGEKMQMTMGMEKSSVVVGVLVNQVHPQEQVQVA
jgi:hypothetical protein